MVSPLVLGRTGQAARRWQLMQLEVAPPVTCEISTREAGSNCTSGRDGHRRVGETAETAQRKELDIQRLNHTMYPFL